MLSNPSRRRLLLGLVLAVPGFPARALRAAEEPITKPVERLYDSLLLIMKQGSEVPFPKRFAAIEPVVDSVMDTAGILRQSMGAAWSGLSATDQAALLDVFRRYTVASYVANFDSFGGQKFEVLADPRQAAGVQIVQTRIIRVSGEKRALDYPMRQVDGSWRIADVLADGTISQVAVQRSDFRALLASGGAAALIASLRRKTADLSGGSIL